MDKEKIKNIKILYYPYKITKKFLLYAKEILALNQIAKHKNKIRSNGKIKVVFILQYVPAWEKADLLYKYLKKQKDFELNVVCVPNDLNTALDTNEAYIFMLDKGYNAINAFNDGGWYDLNKLEPEYIFTFRPYDHFMPVQYSAKNLSRIGKLCNIIYGPPMTAELQNTVYDKNFFNYVSLFFGESIEAKEYFETQHKLGVKSKLQSALFCGMPVMEYIHKREFLDEISSWKLSNRIKILWTPRWNTDEKVGGSHFFDYKDELLSYKEKKKDRIDVMIRPHPLMFSNFDKTKQMSPIEREVFLARCKTNEIVIDSSESYIHTFFDTDILITDISSIVQEFFVLGKPIIYCPPTDYVHPTKTMGKIASACYIVNNSEELILTLNKLVENNDWLINKRKEILYELFGDTLNNSCEQIANVLKNC